MWPIRKLATVLNRCVRVRVCVCARMCEVLACALSLLNVTLFLSRERCWSIVTSRCD